MRAQFHAELDRLAAGLQVMCRRDRAAIAAATNALVNADIDAAEHTLDLCREIENSREDSETAAVSLLALQAPVAGELRQVVVAVQLVGDLVRMATLAGHIAEIARLRHPEHAVPEPVRLIVAKMGAAAIAMATTAAQILGSRDPVAAADLERRDDLMDELHTELLAVILASDWPGTIAAAVDATLLGRYYERFADHTVQVGLRTVFVATGRYPTSTTAHPEE